MTLILTLNNFDFTKRLFTFIIKNITIEKLQQNFRILQSYQQPIRISFMTLKHILLVLFLVSCLFHISSSGQNIDTSGQGTETIATESLSTKKAVDEYDDTFFEAGFATMIMIFMLAFLLLVIVGVAIAIVIILIILGLALTGIFSTSLIVGLYKRSFSQGFKTFSVLAFAFAGLFLYSIAFPTFNRVVHWTTLETALLTGAILGLLTFSILKRLAKYFMGRIEAA